MLDFRIDRQIGARQRYKASKRETATSDTEPDHSFNSPNNLSCHSHSSCPRVHIFPYYLIHLLPTTTWRITTITLKLAEPIALNLLLFLPGGIHVPVSLLLYPLSQNTCSILRLFRSVHCTL